MSSLPGKIRRTAKLSGSFTLRSGKVSDTYFDKYPFEAQPTLLREIAQALAPLVPVGTEVLAGLEMGGIPVVTMLSPVTGLPAAFVRKATKCVAHPDDRRKYFSASPRFEYSAAETRLVPSRSACASTSGTNGR